MASSLLRCALHSMVLAGLACLQSSLHGQGPDRRGKGSSGESACPYLREQIDRHAVQIRDGEITGEVLSNLKRLEAAELLMQAAARLAETGQRREAIHCLEMIEQLCPGSRLAADASEKTLTLRGASEHRGDQEPAETNEGSSGTGSCPGCRGCRKRKPTADLRSGQVVPGPLLPGMEEQLRGLLKAYHLAIAIGDQGKAAELAVQARALDPGCIQGAAGTVPVDCMDKERAERNCARGDMASGLECPVCSAGPSTPSAACMGRCCPPPNKDVVQVFEELLRDGEESEEAIAPQGQAAAGMTAGMPALENSSWDRLMQQVEQSLEETCQGLFSLHLDQSMDCSRIDCMMRLGVDVAHFAARHGLPMVWLTPDASGN